MPYLFETENVHGTPVSAFTCDTCSEPYTVCPVVEVDRRDEWTQCLADGCPSYDVARDAELYFMLGQVAATPQENGADR